MINTTEYKLYHGAWTNKVAPHKSKKLRKDNASELLKGGGYFVRNTYNFDIAEGRQFWYVIKDSYGGVEELPSKVRNQVRKSLKTYDFRKVDAKEMIEKGFELYNQSRERFGKELQVTYEVFSNRCNNPGQDFWLGIDRETGKAECLAFNRCFEDYCSYVSMGVNPNAPKSTYPMYGLILEMNRYYLEELGLKYVMDGARSITEHSNIQPFLEEKFKFRKAYCELQIFYKPIVGIAVKILFPFRKLIKHPKVAAILRQEAWARGLEK